MSPTILSILMLTGIALVLGGLHLIFRKRDTKRGLLMLVLAMVMFVNVGIWTIPTDTGPLPSAPQ